MTETTESPAGSLPGAYVGRLGLLFAEILIYLQRWLFRGLCNIVEIFKLPAKVGHTIMKVKKFTRKCETLVPNITLLAFVLLPWAQAIH